MVADLVADDPSWTLETAVLTPEFTAGIDLPGVATSRTARLWPHLLDGEGQFVALLRRSGAPPGHLDRTGRTRPTHDHAGHTGHTEQRCDREAAAVWRAFQVDTITGELGRPDIDVCTRGDRVLLAPPSPPPLPDRLLTRPGTPLGRARPGRFEPARALAGLLATHTCPAAAAWPAGDDRWPAYLAGAELTCGESGDDGWVLVTAHGWGLGWARRRHGVLKNFLPRSLRRPNRR